MARHFHPAPCARELSLLVDDEGAALDAADLFSVHVLGLHDAKLVSATQLGVTLAEVRVVLGIEVEKRLSALLAQSEVAATGAGKLKSGTGFAERFQRL